MQLANVLDLAVDAVVLNFDGVLVRSVGIKNQAFIDLYAHHGPDVRARLAAYLAANAGVPRLRKFAIIETEFLGRAPSALDLDLLGRRFADKVVDRIVACPAIVGALDFLDRYARTLPVYVVSATPKNELREIVERRGWQGYFAGLYGAPTSKAQGLREILATRGGPDARVVMVGDSVADEQAAAAADIPFVGVVGRGQPSPFHKNARILSDLEGLALLLSA